MSKQVRKKSAYAAAIHFIGKSLDDLCDFIGLGKLHERGDFNCTHITIDIDKEHVNIAFGNDEGSWHFPSGVWIVRDDGGYTGYDTKTFNETFEEIVGASCDGCVRSEEIKVIDEQW